MIVPNKMADFLWHSHMQDNEGYKKDMTTMLKRVLNHIDDFSQADLQKHQANTEIIRAILLPPVVQKVNTTTVIQNNNVGYGFIFYGEGICGGVLAEEE